VYAPLSICGTPCYQTKPAAFKANLGLEESLHTKIYIVLSKMLHIDLYGVSRLEAYLYPIKFDMSSRESGVFGRDLGFLNHFWFL
jgi:hypothetical protein